MRFHIEIQIADDDLLLVRVRIEPGVGAADLLDPLEVDRPLGTRQLPFSDELEIGAADLKGQSATRIVVVGALLDVRLEEVAADGYFLRGAAIARNFGMNDFLFVGHLFALGDGSNGDLLSAIEHAFRARAPLSGIRPTPRYSAGRSRWSTRFRQGSPSHGRRPRSR